MAEKSPACIRVSDLAARWDCSPGKVRMMLKKGILPHMDLGGMVRIPLTAVHALEARCQTPTARDSFASRDARPGTSDTTAAVYLRAAKIGRERSAS